MTAQGEDILAYLDSAITAREKLARAAADAVGGERWDGADREVVFDLPGGDTVADGVMRGDMYESMKQQASDHIALNDPASVLRRCAADRKILELHQGVADHGRFSEPECPADCDGQHDGPPVCMACRDYAGDPLASPCFTVRFLAEGYGWTEGER